MLKQTDSAAGGAMPGAPPADIADAFASTRLLIIAASKLAAEGDETHDYALGSVLSAAEEKFTVALDWFEAMAWEERKAAPEPIAAKASESTIADPLHRELVHVVDDINAARYFVECAMMAADHLDVDERNAMQAALGIAQDKLLGARSRLDKARGAPERKAA
jgi:hypothetical protein